MREKNGTLESPLFFFFFFPLLCSSVQLACTADPFCYAFAVPGIQYPSRLHASAVEGERKKEKGVVEGVGGAESCFDI